MNLIPSPPAWNRSGDITERDIEIAILDGHTQSMAEMETAALRAVERGECAPDEQSRLNWTWDVLIRRGAGR